MNRQEALDWCVENMPEWDSIYLNGSPIISLGFVPYKNPLYLRGNHGNITKQNWLDAKARLNSSDVAFVPEETAQWKNGLPPVGVECEYAAAGPDDVYGGICTIKGLNDGKVWIFDKKIGDVVISINKIVFRPLKTEAEKKLELLSSSFLAAFDSVSDDFPPIKNEVLHKLCKAMLDLGFTAPNKDTRPLEERANELYELVKDAVDLYQACEILINAGYKKSE